MTEGLVASIAVYDYEDAEEPVSFEFANNIMVGVSTKEDIIAAYGEPTDVYESEYSYEATYKYEYIL